MKQRIRRAALVAPIFWPMELPHLPFLGELARAGDPLTVAAPERLASLVSGELEEALAAPLRTSRPPVLGIVRDGPLLLDCPTLADDELDEIAAVGRVLLPR